MYLLLQTFITVVLSVFSRCSEVSIFVDISHQVAFPSENVTVNCRVRGVNPETSVRWMKSVTGSNDLEEIATNAILSPLYKFMERYEVVIIPIDDVVFYLLNIYEVTIEDSGVIDCYLPNGQHSDSPALLHVYQEPEVVHFVNYTEGDVITLTENQVTAPIECRAVHVQPLPHIVIQIGTRHITNHHHLLTSHTQNVFCRRGAKTGLKKEEILKLCPMHFDYNASLVIPYLRVTYRDDGQRMTCLANSTNVDWTHVTTSLIVNVRYKPRFNCSNSVSAELNAREVVIICLITYNPQLSEVSVRWRHTNHKTESRIIAGETYGDYHLKEMVLDSPKESEVRLTISHVNNTHFTMYRFEAENAIGTTEHIVLLQKIPSSTHPTSFSGPIASTTKRFKVTKPAHTAASSTHATTLPLTLALILYTSICT